MDNIKPLYAVVRHYFGKFDDRSVICFCDCRDEAEHIANILAEADCYKGRPFLFVTERLYDFNEVPYSDFDKTADELAEEYRL